MSTPAPAFAETDAIEIRSVALGREPGWRARIGMVALASGMTAEEELHRMLPRDEVLLLTTRVSNRNAISLESLADMERDMARAAATILPEERVDVMIYSCTSGTIAMGEQTVVDRIRQARPGVTVTTPYTGAVAGFTALGVDRVAMLTPYTREVTAAMRADLRRRGITVTSTVALGLSLDSEMSRVDPETLLDVAAQSDHEDAEALFISCTALRTATVIEPLEQRLGKPVVTSNQALAWHALRLAGYADPIPGLGRLMRLPLATG